VGKGTITGGGTDGLYDVDISYHRGSLDDNVEMLAQALIDIQTKIDSVDSDIDALSLDLSSLTWEAYNERTKQINSKIRERSFLKMQKLSIEKRIDVLNDIPESRSLTDTGGVWCADFAEELSGEVGILEIPGESVSFNIAPSGGGTTSSGGSGSDY